MKRLFTYLTIILIFGVFSFSSTSCNRGTGCPINDNATVKTNRKGKLPKRGGKSNLFPKNMRRKGG